MRSSLLLSAAVLLISGSSSLRLVRRDGTPSIIGLGIQRKPVPNPVARDRLRKRQSKTVSATLDNEETLYFANVSIGTPPQDLRLHIDTGSSDMWTNAAASDLCQSQSDVCSISGTYDANTSSTYQFISGDFNISYVDGSGALGDYVSDNLNIGQQVLEGVQFGVGYQSTSQEGILGIGYPANEVQVNRNGKDAYDNVPQAMASKGLIQSNAYSLWLDDLESSTGSIMFGGVDTDKFHGQLETLPIQQTFGRFREFMITLTQMKLSVNGKNQDITTDLPTPVLLDSGSSLSYLPDSLVQGLYSTLRVQYVPQTGAGFIPCSFGSSENTLSFTFSTPTIEVPLSELVIDPGTDSNGNEQTFSNGEKACIFGIAPSDGSTSVLGDTFIRSAYLVYDLANNEISMAQTNFNSTSSQILEIGTGSDSVPSASLVPNPVQASVSETGGARINAPTASATLTSGASRRSGFLMTDQIILAVAGLCGILGLW